MRLYTSVFCAALGARRTARRRCSRGSCRRSRWATACSTAACSFRRFCARALRPPSSRAAFRRGTHGTPCRRCTASAARPEYPARRKCPRCSRPAGESCWCSKAFAVLVGGDDVGIALYVVLGEAVGGGFGRRGLQVVQVAVLLLIVAQALAHVVEHVLGELPAPRGRSDRLRSHLAFRHASFMPTRPIVEKWFSNVPR